MVSEKLLEPSPYLSNAHPWLATDVVQVENEGKIWEAEIRQGVKWHDGSEMTAEDIAFTYNLYLNGPSNRWTHHVSDVPRIEKIEAISPTRVQFEAPRPMPNFDLVTAPEMPILQKKQWDGVADPRTFSEPVIGTGPYLMAFLPIAGNLMTITCLPWDKESIKSTPSCKMQPARASLSRVIE